MRPSPADVGRRVVVRHRLPDGRATDVVGELRAWGPDDVRVLTAAGREVTVAAGAVVAARVVGAPARTVTTGAAADDVAGGDAGGGPLTVTVDRAARTTAPGWAAREEVALGAWSLRSGSPRMKRGASALAVGDPGVSLGAALAAVAEHYRSRGLEPAVQVNAPLPGGAAGQDDPGPAGPGAGELERALAAGGWLAQPWTVLAVRPAPVGPVHGDHDARGDRADRAHRARAATVRVSPSPGPAWLAASDHHGAPLTRSDLPPERDGVAVAYAGAPAPGATSTLASRDGAGPLVAVARGALAHRWLGITCVVVDPAHRRRGLSSALVDALVDHLGGPAGGLGSPADDPGHPAGGRAGAPSPVDALYVQVVASNTVARDAWRSTGFVDHSRYRFWTLPAPA